MGVGPPPSGEAEPGAATGTETGIGAEGRGATLMLDFVAIMQSSLLQRSRVRSWTWSWNVDAATPQPPRAEIGTAPPRGGGEKGQPKTSTWELFTPLHQGCRMGVLRAVCQPRCPSCDAAIITRTA